MKVGFIVLILIGTLVVLTGLILLLYFLFIRNQNLKKQLNNLDNKYEYLHNLLIAQDKRYLERINYISQINLLYGSIYDKYNEKYKFLCENKDVYAAKIMQEYKDFIKDKKYASVRKDFNEYKQFMEEFEKEVNELNNGLLQIIRPEEECNRLLLEMKESFRLVKQDYTAHQNDLLILKKSYEIVFNHVESLFKKYEDYVEQANYDEASNLIPEIKKIIVELDNINKAMPNLCVLASREVPQKISDLVYEYKKMTDEENPVYHLVTETSINYMRKEVEDITRKLKGFEYKNASKKLNAIIMRIDNTFIAFKKEREDKKIFQEEVDAVYERFNVFEKDFIKLCNFIPKIKSVYIISEEKLNFRNKIQSDINKAGVSKRSLDTFIHSASRQPYSLLLMKTIELKDECGVIEQELSEYRKYLSSLKIDVERAHELVFQTYYRLKKAEKILRDANIPNFTNKYQSKIDDVYTALEVINTTTSILPIDVAKINESANYLRFEGESIINQIDQDENMMQLAESAIVYANKDRNKSAAVNNILVQNETMFFDGEFEKAYNATREILKRSSDVEF